ncbi:MAG: peptide chain release factor 1 [Clostridia bacterium]|nr:peptide chain release factor 1 [Clostridia bacterium]
MINKLKPLKERYDELTELIVNPEVIADNKKWQGLVKERSRLEEIKECYDEMFKINSRLESAKAELEIETDSEMKALLEEEYYDNKDKYEKLIEQAKILLLPKDENDENNVIMEIRAGAGGDEAGIFAKDLLKMYTRYAERMRWKVEIDNISENEAGGIKEVTLSINGKNAFKNLKFESGVHRVQRVPETESQGRVHTSTATVAVLPELEEVEFEMNEKDFRIDTYRSSGAGGQHINKTDSAIRITHIPTGIVVACQDERSQFKNRDRAWSVMRSKLYDFYQGQKDREYAENRKLQVGTGDRSEKIRTYNYPQSRITDHRINLTIHSLAYFMDGDIQEMINELQIADQREKLENSGLN